MVHVIDGDLQNWISKLWPRDWEDFYHKSEKVKLLKDEMDALVERLYEAKGLARYNESAANSVEGIKDALLKKRRELIDAIEGEKKHAAASEIQAAQETRATRQLQLNEEGTKTSKSAQRWAVISVAISAFIAIVATPLVNHWLQKSRDAESREKLKTELRAELEESLVKPLREREENSRLLSQDLSRKIDALELRITELAHKSGQTEKTPQAVKKKLKGRPKRIHRAR